jgi:transcriptional regulator with XRE-family HTH domain
MTLDNCQEKARNICKDALYMPRSKKEKSPPEDLVQHNRRETVASFSPSEELGLRKREEVNRNLANFNFYFRKEVRRRRKELGLKQEHLSYALGMCNVTVGQSYISNLETGKKTNPTLEVVIALTTLLSISLDQLLLDVKETETTKKEDTKEEKEEGKEIG